MGLSIAARGRHCKTRIGPKKAAFRPSSVLRAATPHHILTPNHGPGRGNTQMANETLSFQTEVGKILHIVANSLYKENQIFLRELISNASDACDRLRHLALTAPDLVKDDPEFRVTIAVERRTLGYPRTLQGHGHGAGTGNRVGARREGDGDDKRWNEAAEGHVACAREGSGRNHVRPWNETDFAMVAAHETTYMTYGGQADQEVTADVK